MEDSKDLGAPLNINGSPQSRRRDGSRCKQSICIPYRYWFALLAFYGFFNVYALRVNLSVAIIDMQTELHWSHNFKGTVLSSFFYGYIVTQIPGGFAAAAYGGKWVLGVGLLGAAVFTMLTPIAARHSEFAVILVRVLMGLFEGVSYPAMHALWSRFSPPLERSKLTTLCYSGAYLGSALSQPMCGYFVKHLGWPSVFYIFGCTTVSWFVLWSFFAASTPAKAYFMSDDERDYIENALAAEARAKDRTVSVGTESSRADHGEGQSFMDVMNVWLRDTPWRGIFSSTAVWAIIVAHFANNFSFYMILTCLPSYLKGVLGFDIENAGVDAAIPYLSMFLVTLVVGRVADFLQHRKILSTKNTRKLMSCSAFIISGVFLVLTGYVTGSGSSSAHAVSVALVSLSIATLGIAQGGHNTNHIDLSVKYSGVLMGLSNTAGTLPGIVMPSFTNAVAYSTDHATLEKQWQLVFNVSAIVNVIGTIFYAIFAQGEPQSFDGPKKGEENEGAKPLLLDGPINMSLVE